MRSIKTKGMVFALTVILIAVSAMGISGYVRIRDILVKEVNNAMERVAAESASHLSYYLKQFVTPLITMSKDEKIAAMDWNIQKEILGSQIGAYYLNVAVVDMEGTAYYLDETVLDLSDRSYVREALEGRLSFSEVIVSRKTQEPVVMVSAPIYQDTMVVGALIARLDVDFLSEYASSRGYGENGRAYIISEEGSFLSRPEEERREGEFNLFSLARKDEEYEALAAFVREAGTDKGYGRYRFGDREILTGYAKIDNTSWKIYIGTNEEDALRSLVSLRILFSVVSILALGLSSLIAYIFVSRFSESIVELEKLFSKGAKGDFTIRFTGKSKDEIGRLGASFNRMMDKIKSLTQYDPLTTLLNQYVLEKEVTYLVQKEGRPDFSLIMVAIDKFSNVNETYGYPVGDIMLCEVARRILCCLDENYQIYRYKGDEFVVMAGDRVTEGELEKKAQYILSEIKKSYLIGTSSIHIRFSIGLYLHRNGSGTEEPLKAVTHAKNYARMHGSNIIRKYDTEIYKKLMGINLLQAEIVQGLKENQFFLVYQPLLYLEDERLAEIEVLIRWKHPEQGLLYPDRFIDIAEQTGSITDIDYWVIETACRQLKKWRESHRTPVLLSVNVSTRTFEMKQFIADLAEMVQRYGVEPSSLQLELTERLLIKNVEESIQRLTKLRQMGFRIAIDDFGIGYSSLSYIVRLPIDCIKIDKSFVQNIASSKEAKTIVSTIIGLCKALRLNVIAEGIENRRELEYLRTKRCDIGQGYYFSKPVMVEEIEKNYFGSGPD